MLTVTAFTALWYYTSSKNAVATQHLVEQIIRGGSTGGTATEDTNLSYYIAPIQIMAALSAFQLLVGIAMACMIHFTLLWWISMHTNPNKDILKNPRHLTRVSLMDKGAALVGILHFSGVLCTNMGFAYGPASLVQIVKLLEPIETVVLTVIVTKSLQSITVKKTVSMLVVIAGTVLLLIQKNGSSVNHTSGTSTPITSAVIFALWSGLSMSARNAVQKSKTECTNQTSIGWDVAALNGINNFIRITGFAAVPALFFFCASVISTGNLAALKLVLLSGRSGFESIVFHGLYNIASISVLSLISAQSHSLLNVGKRVSNILVAAYVFHEKIGPLGIAGLVIAALGSFAYSKSTHSAKNKGRSDGGAQFNFSSFKNKIIIAVVITCAANAAKTYLGLHSLTIEDELHLSTELSLSTHKIPSTSNFAVWMFPFPPPRTDISISSDSILICAYSNACDAYKDHVKINLRSLTTDTFFQNYVRDHNYHKVRHMQDFPLHIHAIAMMALLQTKPGACVQTLGSNERICNPKIFEKYNPYNSVDLKSTEYPYLFLQNQDSSTNNLLPDLGQEKFAMWGHEDTGISTYGYNSGEDVQSYASTTWLPFVSEIRLKEHALLNYTGFYIGNALVNYVLETSESDLKNMNKISLLSIFIGDKKVVKKMQPYLRAYTNTISPFGSRSTVTNQILREIKIKSYFSACLTLTMNMQGATIDVANPNPDNRRRNRQVNHQHIENWNILGPNSRELPTPKEKTMILIIDALNFNIIPQGVKDRAVYASADIPRNHDVANKKMGRYDYSYRLLSLYANQAKVIITSRIHVGLPAAAMGIPVIFTSDGNKMLPGGAERTGRVTGLLEVFHQVAPSEGRNWTFGDLSGDVPPNPGNHLADRYRASFWNRLKKTHFYGDTARLYGIVPLQRLGAANVRPSIQNKFHFVLRKYDLSWQTKRSIEHVFFFHPNSQVYVHSNDINSDDLAVFAESGYDLIVQKVDIDDLKEDVFAASKPVSHVLDHPMSIYFLILWKYGGVYVSKNTMIVKELPITLENGVIMEEESGMPAMVYLKKHSSDAYSYLKGYDDEQKYKVKDWSLPVLTEEETHKCIEDEGWKLGGMNSNDTGVVAVSLHPITFASTTSMKYKSACFEMVEELCIYCDEAHWDF